jgi:hypothetical protein
LHPANQTIGTPADIGAGEELQSMSYRVVLESDGRGIETFYWSGSLEETRVLAREVALKRGADAFRIFEVSNGNSEVWIERRPFGGARGDC